MHDPIAYTYEGGAHCPDCTRERFGVGPNGYPGEGSTDREGNEPGAIAPWDEWHEPSNPARQYLVCDTCGDVLDEHEGEREVCDACDGTGLVMCDACGGSGEVEPGAATDPDPDPIPALVEAARWALEYANHAAATDPNPAIREIHREHARDARAAILAADPLDVYARPACLSCSRSWAGTCPRDAAGAARNSADCGAYTPAEGDAPTRWTPAVEDLDAAGLLTPRDYSALAEVEPPTCSDCTRGAAACSTCSAPDPGDE